MTIRRFLICGAIILAMGIILFKHFHKRSNDLNMDISFCNSVDLNERTACQLNQVEAILKNRGIDAALYQVASLASQDSNFLPLCHGFVHKVGQAAFLEFADKKNFSVSSKVTICSYGFYHGFMEALWQVTGNYAMASGFCDYIDSQLKVQGLDLSSECYHGIGHGVVLSHDPKLSGDAITLTDKALKICEQVSETTEHRRECASGVFNGIANGFNEEEFGLKIEKKQNPFKICVSQADLYRPTCYGFMARVLLSLKNGNLSKAIKFAVNNVDKNYLNNVIANLANIYTTSNYTLKKESDFIDICNGLSSRWLELCLGNIAQGLFQNGPPGTEYSEPFSLCQSERLNLKLQTHCLATLWPGLYKLYGSEKSFMICGKLNRDHEQECKNYAMKQ